MGRGLYYPVLLLLFAAQAGVAQIRAIKPIKPKVIESNFGIGIGYASSVLNLPINVLSSNNAKGIHGSLTYDKGNYLRFALEYTTYNSIDVSPTWQNIKARTLECNINFISKTKDKTFYFYPIAGLSYNMFKGFFTGINDYLNLSAVYTKNVVIKNDWFGVNAGLGLDYNFSNMAITSCFKMRVGRTEGYDQINIMDVYQGIGFRYYVKRSQLGKLFRGTRSRYLLRTKKASS